MVVNICFMHNSLSVTIVMCINSSFHIYYVALTMNVDVMFVPDCHFDGVGTRQVTCTSWSNHSSHADLYPCYAAAY